MRTARVLLVAGVLALTAGCSSGAGVGSPAGSSTGRSTGTLHLVAGENFWGSLLSQLAGRAGTVTSIVSDPNADPHNYESSSSDARAFADADYVVLNGAGYDAWAQKLLSGNPNSRRKVLTVANLLGKKEGDNPHFWYSPTYVSQVIDRMQVDLTSIEPVNASYFASQRRALDAAMSPYQSQLASIKARFASTRVASTESIFIYLGQYLGLDVISPPEFMKAVAEGNDPSPASVAEFENQISSKQAKLLVFNDQTSTAITTNIEMLARRAGIPVIGLTETVQPPGESYEQWLTAELGRLQTALGGGAA